MMDTTNNIKPIAPTVIPTPSPEELRPTIPYLHNLTRLSKVISMWPESKKPRSYLYHFRVWFTATYCLSVIVSFSIRIIENITHLDSVAILVDFLTVFMSGTFRYIYVYLRGDTYLHLVSQMHDNFIECSLFPKKNRASLLKYYKFANKVIISYAAFILFWVLQICTTPVLYYIFKTSQLVAGLNETLAEPIKYPVLMEAYAPFDYYTQPNNILFYIYQFYGYMTMCGIYVLVDCFWYMVIFLTMGQFVMLKDSLDTISEILSNDDGTEVEPLRGNELESVREGLKHCIRHHQFSRAFVRLVEDLSNPVILADTIHVMISVAFMLFNAILGMNTGDWNKALYSFEYFVTSIAHMFFFDWLGNELAEQEQEVADSLHKIPWYKCPTEKPLIIIMSLQARKPYYLTGGRMFKLTLEFFTNTSKAIFSVFTFLLKMIDR